MFKSGSFVLLLVILTACSPAAVTPFPPTIEETPALPDPVLVDDEVTPTVTDTQLTIDLPTSTFEAPLATQAGETGENLPMCSPLQEHSIADLFEIVSDPYNPPPMGRDERHQGVDFSYYQRGDRDTIEGVPITTILPGRVVSRIQDVLPYGNMVMIETTPDQLPEAARKLYEGAGEWSLYHLYAHMQNAPEVQMGDSVECGQVLGLVGKTGYNIVNPHLHFEIRTGPAGVVFDEISFYNTKASEQAMANYRLWRMSGEFQHYDPMNLFEAYLTSSEN